ncbi:MAG: IclR family transcriptional regulator [Phenylobacterium sp.]|uniref:IclR family transcriptional regulator n=1 Tax=Phenylobacterium sp. TaxID=1871053 RepID=UPI001A606C08|nr:IclR family transcriptional regulator [Phenylobacterium sp.]MBL8556179.1 IclR family transcriptional regulator [Phenylobacterium sp.]
MTDNVLSAARVLDLIELIAAASDGVLLREATVRLNAPKSSTLMLLRTLVNRGYVARDPLSDRYALTDTFRAGGYGWHVDPHAALVAAARPIMEELVVALGESTTFGVFHAAGQAKVVAQVVADVEVRYAADTDRPIPFYCTAIGRVLVSGRPESDWSQMIGDGPLPAVTRHTVTDKGAILEILGRVRRQGHAVVVEEFALGGTGVAAPVFDREGRVVAALNAGCVTNRFEDKRDRVIAAVKAAAGAVSEQLGHPARAPDAVT